VIGMKSFERKIALSLLGLAVVAAVAVVAAADTQRPEPTGSADSVRDLVYARPFALERPYVYDWTRERAEVAFGYILVVTVDPAFAQPRQVDMPVLYVGDTPAQITNIGYESGHLIVIAPGEIDLTEVPIFFGSTELPERVDRVRGRLEMEAALEVGVRAFASQRVAEAYEAGGDTLRVARIEELLLTIADLIEIYAPDESEAAEIYRMLRERL
jgi:hypothetical protein